MTIRGTPALTPAMNGIDARKEHIVHVPLSAVAGTCDAMWDDSRIPLTTAPGNPHAEQRRIAIECATTFFGTDLKQRTNSAASESAGCQV